jgi:hypothetical protein
MQFPNAIVNFLSERQERSNSPCHQCNAACCNGPGFALLENVLEIYERYVAGNLVRSDYSFEPNLPLSQFIFKYFDRVLFNGSLLVFFPKTLSDTGLNSTPPWNYYQAREYLNRRSPSLGCIFLSKKQVPGDQSNNCCILHSDKARNNVTEKPIDCTFLVCNGLKNVMNPSGTETNLWLSLLDYYFPDSHARFQKLCPDMPE